ncbi:DUF4625 domain-containing protein [Pleomorphovibrio marinus]|uniref:DUF4625 domain-containing protein n=1 Tax=Pleomorphovibrio marinus TaxID=2164132 RepID=UPI000E0A1126|nr:DUF4625 domain-containing protein [Pleomorphovibrio marinus]
MKKTFLYPLIGLAFVMAACETDDDPIRDLDAPIIGPADGRDAIRPENEEARAATTDHMHVRFGVDDPSGIAQIRVDVHNSFDGHTHGRIKSDFEPLNVDDIYSPNAASPDFLFPEGATRVSIDGPGTDIYWGGPSSRVEGNVLAGPYDFTIQAIDIHGNQTSFADESNYFVRFHIRRAYAPVVDITNLHDGEIEGEAGEPLQIEGTIGMGDHELSSEIAFIWVRLTDEDEHGHGGHDSRVLDEYYEQMWGSSAWRGGMSGPEIPNTQSLNLADVFVGDNAIIPPAGADHLNLIIWVEDQNGNITEMTYEVHLE